MLLDVAFKNLFEYVWMFCFFPESCSISVLLDETEIVSEEENRETKQRNCQQE